MKKLSLPLLLLAAIPTLAHEPAVQISTTYANQVSYVSDYSSEFKLRVPGSSQSWTAKNFNNNNSAWPNIRCGSKEDATTATITTDFAIDTLIRRVDVEVTLYASGASNRMSAMAILVSPNADMTDSTVYPADLAGLPTTNYDSSTISIPIADAKAGQYYQLRIEMPKVFSSGSYSVNSLKYYAPDPEETPGQHGAQINFANTADLHAVYTGDKEIAPSSSYSETNPCNLNGATFELDNAVRMILDQSEGSWPKWYEAKNITPELRLNPDNTLTVETIDEDCRLIQVQFVQGTSAETYFNDIDNATAETNLGPAEITNKTWNAPQVGIIDRLTLTFHNYCRCNGLNITYLNTSEQENNVAIQTVSIDLGEQPAEYFDLSGHKLPAAPSRPGLYIKRTPAASTLLRK